MKKAWEKAHKEFLVNLDAVRLVGHVYQNFVDWAPVSAVDMMDLLRGQLVNTLSAFDLLIHEYVRAGLQEQLVGASLLTRKTGTFTLDADCYLKLSVLGSSPADIVQKANILSVRIESVLRTLTFQSPEKIKDALSYIWDEPHKWYNISVKMGLSEKDLTQKIQLYVERRNQIVHEADYDRVIDRRRPLVPATIQDCIGFYERLANVLHAELMSI